MTLNKLKRVLFFQKKNIQLLHIGDCEKKKVTDRKMKKKSKKKIYGENEIKMQVKHYRVTETRRSNVVLFNSFPEPHP